ncbi:MAG: sugar-binding domain-containing protein [Bacteroidota bacterium]
MNLKILLSTLLITSITSLYTHRVAHGQEMNSISLDGDWTMKHFDFGMGTWKPAWGIFMAFPPPEVDQLRKDAMTIQVPGSIQHSLVDLGIVEDPYIGDNAKEILWVEEHEWWLTKSVDIPEEWEGKGISLKCNMINYQADVWVNDTWVGRTIGNYLPMDIAVAKQLTYGAKNDIVVRLRAPENSTNYIKNNLFIDWRIRDREVLHERPWVTPSNPQAGEYLISKCFFGWDWGPHLVPIGILQPIKLEAKDQQTVENVFVKTTSIDNNEASL